jgi:hypothetical protein
MLKVSMTLNDVSWREFCLMCNKHGYKYSTRINLLIQRDIEAHKGTYHL